LVVKEKPADWLERGRNTWWRPRGGNGAQITGRKTYAVQKRGGGKEHTRNKSPEGQFPFINKRIRELVMVSVNARNLVTAV